MTMAVDGQRGAALLVALMILVLTAILGVVAMKSSVFSSRLAVGTQLDALAFEGAESALAESFQELGQDTGIGELARVLDGNQYQRCVTKDDRRAERLCAIGDHLDSRGLVRSQVRAGLSGRRPVVGGQVSVSGSGAILVDYEVSMLGEADIDAYDVSNHHVQETLKRGLMAAGEVE